VLLSVAPEKIELHRYDYTDIIIYDIYIIMYAVPGGSASANFTTSARAQPGSALELLSVAQTTISFHI